MPVRFSFFIPNRIRRFWTSMESLIKKERRHLCHERNVEGKVNKIIFRVIAKKSVSSIMNEK